jgi:hypothetical protein
LAFRHVNLNLDFKDGFIAKDMKVFFSTYKNWKIGFFFGTKDLIMSSVFGDISPYDQESLILSKRGLPNLASDFTNLKVWVRDTPMHTFLLLSESAKLESFDGISAIDFAKSVYDEKD